MRMVNNMSDRLYVGIDLGTYQSTISSSAGASHTIETIVGRPKDPVARNFLGRDVLFGNDALKNKLACNLYRPMAAGVAQDDEANLAAAKAFVSHLLETVDPEEYDEVFGVICSPSHIKNMVPATTEKTADIKNDAPGLYAKPLLDNVTAKAEA